MSVNRYVAEGLVRDAESGLRVFVVTHRSSKREMLGAIEVALSDVDQSHKIRRANGRERVEFTLGGFIAFRTPGMSNRGFSADVLYVENWIYLTEEQMTDLIPMVACGELIRA